MLKSDLKYSPLKTNVGQKWYELVALHSLFRHIFFSSKLKGHYPLNSIEPVTAVNAHKNWL
jgi:hypothetical protein